jgi:4-oxalocrotonate tautomerase
LTKNFLYLKMRNTTPLAQIKGVSGYLTVEQKQEIIKKVTNAIVSVEGEGLRPITWVLIEDVNSDEWGVAGEPVTTEDLRKISEQGG